MLIHYGMSRKIVFSLFVLLCGALIALNGEAAEAARSGFALWQNSVMPALLPFFVCTGLMRKLGLISLGNPAALMALSFISGAPGGARLCAGIYGDSTQDNTVMAASLNALSPMFITGAFASSMLRCPQAAIPIVSAQLIAMLVFFIAALKATPMPAHIEAREEKANAGVLFAASVTEAAASLISICGMIVFFSVLMRMMEITGLLSIIAWPLKQLILLLNGPGHAAEVMICAAVEAATGACRIADAALSLREATALAAFAFSFGGLCIMAQSMIFMRIDIKKYLICKLAQGMLAALIAYLLFPLCCNGAQSVTAEPEIMETLGQNSLSALAILACSMAAMGAVMLICAAKARLERLKNAGIERD